MDFKASKCIHYDNSTGKVGEYLYDPVSPFIGAIEFYCASIERGEQGPQPITTGYDVDELIETVERSAREGAAIEVNWRI